MILWPIKGVMKRTELIPVGWNSKKKVSNMQHNHGPVGTIDKNDFRLME